MTLHGGRPDRAHAPRELERIFEERQRWLAEPAKYCDFSNPMCRLGWADSYAEEMLHGADGTVAVSEAWGKGARVEGGR
jgi:transposase